MAVKTLLFQLRQRRLAVRLAITFTVLGVFLIAPIYLGAQWGPAQSPTAPWWVALVREPFFAKIMLFGEGPAFWPLFAASWALALTFWGLAISAWRKPTDADVVRSASNSNTPQTAQPNSLAA